jgi:hypothetical protein
MDVSHLVSTTTAVAFKKYGLVIPEMAAHGVLYTCAACGVRETPENVFLACPCKVPRYCSRECQVKHWKSSHKKECSTTSAKKSTATEGSSSSPSGASPSAPLMMAGLNPDAFKANKEALERLELSTKGKGNSKAPRQSVVDKVMKDITHGMPPPMPGTEESAAWKVACRQLIALANTAEDRATVEKTVQHYVWVEEQYWKEFPDAPDWSKE